MRTQKWTSASGKPGRLPTALAGVAVGVAGVAGSFFLPGQLAAAMPDDTNEAVTDSAEVETLDDGDQEWAEFDNCLVDQGVLTAEDLEMMYAVPEDWDDEDWDFDETWMEGVPFVAVENGDELTFVEFGEGNATVTIEKVGDEITVSSSGDVVQETADLYDEYSDEQFSDEQFDESAGEVAAEIEAEIAAWEAATEACEHLTPGGELGEFGFESGEMIEFHESGEGVYAEDSGS